MSQDHWKYGRALSGRRESGPAAESLPLFIQPWWLDAVCKHWSSVSIEQEGRLEAIWCFQLENKWGLRLLRNPPLCPYMGPVFFAQGAAPHQEMLEALFRQLPRVAYLQFTTLPGLETGRFFSERGLLAERRRTFYVDLRQDEDFLFNAIQPRRRNYIRSASRQLYVETSTDPDLELFVQWHRRAFEKKGKAYPYNLRLIRNVFDQGKARGNSPFLIARQANGAIAAMLWTPVDRDKAYHLLAAIDPGLKVNGTMDFLTWEAMRRARAAGLSCYDFEGSMDEGIARFFRNFGGEEQSFMAYEHTFSQLWRLKRAWLG